MIYDVDITKMININKGSVSIERVQDSSAALSFDDKFKPYVTVVEKKGSLNVQVSDNLKESIKFRLNLPNAPKCLVHVKAGVIEATSVCQYTKYSIDAGNMYIKVPHSLVGIADLQVVTGALDVNNGSYTAYGTSNNYRYRGTSIEQRSYFVVTTGNMKFNTQ